MEVKRRFSFYDADAVIGIRNAEEIAINESDPEYIFDILDWKGHRLASISKECSRPIADAWLIKNAFRFYLMLEKLSRLEAYAESGDFDTDEYAKGYAQVFREFRALKVPASLLKNCRHNDYPAEILKRDPMMELRKYFEEAGKCE